MPIQMFAMITETSDQLRRGEPVDRVDADDAERRVDHAGVAVEHPRPGGRRDDQRQQPRHEEQRPQRARQREVLVEEEGQRHADGELEGQRGHGEDHGVRQRRPEGRVGQDRRGSCPGRRRARRPARTSGRCTRAGSTRRCGRAGRRRRRPGRRSPGPGSPRPPTGRPGTRGRRAGRWRRPGAAAAAAAPVVATAVGARCWVVVVTVSATWSRLSAVGCAAVSASCGVFAPLSAACTAVHRDSEIFGYLVPRLSPVRPLAARTASTQTLSFGSAATCRSCTAATGAT